MVNGYNVALKINDKTIVGRTQDDLTIAATIKESQTKDDAGSKQFAVIGQEYDLVLPFTGLFVADVTYQLVHRCTRLFYRTNRQATYADIQPSLRVHYAFVIVQKSEIIFRSVGFHLVERVICLVS